MCLCSEHVREHGRGALPGFFSMFPHHQNEEREGGKGGEEGRDWGAQERSDKIEKPRSKEDPFRSTIFECDDFD